MLRYVVVLAVGGALLAQPATADLLGLGPDEVIETIGFTTYGATGASYQFGSDSLLVGGQLLDITTEEGVVHLDIGGGGVTFAANFEGETTTLFPAYPGYALYEARFTGPAVKEAGLSLDLSAPNPLLKEDGNLLKGDVIDLTISGIVNLDNLAATGLSMYAHFDVSEGLGNELFEPRFGASMEPPDFDGTIVAGTREFSDGGLASLMALDDSDNVLLFSREDAGIASFSFELTSGEIQPAHPSVPEPTTLAAALCVALLLLRRSRSN